MRTGTSSCAGAGPKFETSKADIPSFLTAWWEAARGKSRLVLALKTLSDVMDAAVVTVSRIAISEGGPAQPHLTYDAFARAGRNVPEFNYSAAREIFAKGAGSSEVATATQLGPTELKQLTRIEYFLRARGIKSVIVVTLEKTDTHVDTLEICLTYPVSFKQVTSIETISTALSALWIARVRGVLKVNHAVEHTTCPKAEVPPITRDILSFHNPLNLSRMEYSVCNLVATGSTRTEIREQLGISNSTLSTHLHNIFFKTRLKSFADLKSALVQQHGA
ncbi:regulatory protein, luxR family [Roseivivax marinus]|nr:regulatory protein, luxR family [Roseivivax marinus]